MRIDQYAYQQATRVAGLGLVLQLAIALVLLVLGRALASTALVNAFPPAIAGVAAWGALVVLFHQHRLAAAEAMEAEELRAARADASVFAAERAGDALVAQRRLRRLQVVFLPAVSIAIAGFLAWAGWSTVSYVNSLSAPLAADSELT